MMSIEEKYLHSDLTDGIIKCFYTVYSKLGYGFLEKVYQNALRIELQKNGYKVECQHKINVFYEGLEVGEYYADMLINNTVIIELKAAEKLCESHALQLLNYLRATDQEIGLLLNFGKKPEIKRKTFLNSQK